MVAQAERSCSSNSGPSSVQWGTGSSHQDEVGNDESSEVEQVHNGPTLSHTHCSRRQEDESPQQGQSELVDTDFNVDDMCDMVMSYKCRHCSFLAQDKATLATHIRHRHIGGGGKRHRHKSSNHHNSSQALVQDELENVGFDVSKIKMNKREIGKEELPPIPSIPPTPEAFFIMSDEEDEDSCQLLTSNQNLEDEYDLSMMNHNNGILDRDPLEMDDVFLCAECDIVFASKELCCKHMHDIHGLEQFSAEFIQEVIISKRPGEEDAMQEDKTDESTSCSKNDGGRRTRKIVKPPKHFTFEEGALVPKRYRVSKSLMFFCSKCLIKYESEEVKKLHEKCHIEPEDLVPVEDNHETLSSEQNSEGKDQPEGTDDDSLGEEIDPRIGNNSDDRNLIKNRSSSEYKFKCPICLSDSNLGETQTNEVEKGTKTTKIATFFTKWSNCAGHLWREHQMDCELYSCNVCKKFKNFYITKVKDHERLHKPESNYACNTCSKKFKQRHQLTTHQKYHKDKATRLPPPADSRWYTPKECHICKRVLSDAKCLKKHISAVHNKLKPYCCNICGHLSARKAELKLHIRQHTGEKPFKCTLCAFATGDHNSLRKHKLRHGNQRPYSCPYCEYRCIQSSAFKKHMVSIHPDQDVVFQCPLCPHASVNEALSLAHAKDHEEGRIPSISTKSHCQNENSSERHSSPANSNENENSNSSTSSNDYPDIGIRSFGRRRRPPLRKPKSPQKPRWLEDDSVDVIDNGGVTIPASPVPIPTVDNCCSRELDPSFSSSSHETQSKKDPQGKLSSEMDAIPQSSSSSQNKYLEDAVRSEAFMSTRNRMEDLITVNLDDIA